MQWKIFEKSDFSYQVQWFIPANTRGYTSNLPRSCDLPSLNSIIFNLIMWLKCKNHYVEWLRTTNSLIRVRVFELPITGTGSHEIPSGATFYTKSSLTITHKYCAYKHLLLRTYISSTSSFKYSLPFLHKTN